jgi:prepilin-type N-terminal cleavage/methylation domain-containing protein
MRHPFSQPISDKDSSHNDDPSGFTLIESLVAVIIVSITVVSVLPPIFWATATRVQNRRAEQAIQLAQSEIERVRTTVERGGQYDINLLPPVDPNATAGLRSASTAAPSISSGIRRSPTAACKTANDAKQPGAVTQYIEIDSDPNNGCTPEFLVQVFRSVGTTPTGVTLPSAFSMGVRVYAAPAFGTLKRGGTLEKDAARLRGSSGTGQQSTRPIAVLYGTVVQSRAGNSLGIYKQLCALNKDC